MTGYQHSDRRRAVQEIACGECGAPVGENCTTRFGAVKYPPHKRRLDNARDRWLREAVERQRAAAELPEYHVDNEGHRIHDA